MSGPGWLQALIDEMVDLHSNDIWDWFLYPMEKLKWVVDGSIQLKLAMMEILVRLFFLPWLLHQLDIKNAFLHGEHGITPKIHG